MTDVVDVAPSGLPRVSARDAAALTRAARVLAGLPATFETTLGELGPVVVTSEGVATLEGSTASEPTGEVAIGLTRAVGAGRLVIDGALARRVIAAALGEGVGDGGPLGRLGLGERGVVAGLVASLLHTLRAPFSVSLAAPRAAAVDEGGVAIALAVAVAGATGWARLELPARWLEAAPARGDQLAGLEVEAYVELARTRLAAAELAAVVPGDAIVFDGEPAFAGERDVRLAVGAYAARARLSADGRVTLEDELRPAPSATRSTIGDGPEPGEVIMQRRDTGNEDARVSGDAGTRVVDVAAVLASAPVEIVAELGRLALRGDEVAGLGPGAVLTLGRVGASPVSLRVGGEIWAEGELVDVEGELGVRITVARRSGIR